MARGVILGSSTKGPAIGRVIHKDPPRPHGGTVLPRSIFDADPARNAGQPGITREVPAVPDELLISTLVEHGQPRWAAEEVRRHPTVRFYAMAFWCTVQDAAEGNKDARERVDRMRAQWAELRKEEFISDIPGHTVGLGDR